VTNEQRSLPEISPHIQQTWRQTRKDHSAGGVAYQWVGEGEVQIALIATHGGARWQLPKGSVEPGETAVETAVREVEEEAGLETVPEQFLKTIEYWYWDTYRKQTPELVHKRVDFFLLRVVGGELSDSSYEVDSVGWFTPAQALQILTFAGEKTVVQFAMEQFRP
jgi:8-oxo-dGTP pyrophosphatase MutT (NUDIX family)